MSKLFFIHEPLFWVLIIATVVILGGMYYISGKDK